MYKRSKKRAFWMAIGVIALSAFLGDLYGPRVQAITAGTDSIQESVRSFTKVFAIIEKNYADPITPGHTIFKGAIPGMLRTLDPHSQFFDEPAYSQLQEQHRGHYYGVGMTVQPYGNRTIIVAPFPGSPAANAGLRPGDIIYKVNDTLTEGLTTTQVAEKLKGPKGTVVQVQVLREGQDQPLTFVITRDEIPQHSVAFAGLPELPAGTWLEGAELTIRIRNSAD